MSVYKKEKPEFLDASLHSVLVKQTVIPDEVVLVKDGPLTDELELVISKYYSNFSSILKVVALPINSGLGKALNVGLEKCSHTLIARMDSDDISAHNRFERQLKRFKSNPELDLIGSNIVEFFDSPDDPIFVKMLPTKIEGIRKMIKRRNPINHVTVMFRKEAVIETGGYLHLLYLEDYYLWVRMLNNGCIMENLNENLVYVRTGEKMFERRSNQEYIRSWYGLQKEMKRFALINRIDIFINMMSITVFILTPPKIKQYIYKVFLRKDVHAVDMV
jgi:glycosyltransferase involved in cell wall biosynthesis